MIGKLQILLNSGRLKNNLESDKNKNNIEIQNALKLLLKNTNFYITSDIKIRYQIIKQELSHSDLICKNQNCNNQVEFNKQNYKFKDYCCVKCMSTSKEILQKKENTCLNKYGVKSVNSTDFKKQQIKDTCLNNFGTDCVFSNNNIINKIKNSHINNFGTHYSQQHLINLENWNDKKFIKDNFLTVDGYAKPEEFGKYFNSQDDNLYKRLNHFEIEYNKRAGVSKPEEELYELYKDYNSELHNKKLIGKELDILIPNILAIEYHGLMFHSYGISKYNMFNNPKANIFRHTLKLDLCECANIQLFQIFENEWINKKEIWKSVINSKLNKTQKIMARKCVIQEVDSKVSKNFLDDNHLQGNRYAKINYGLYYNNILVSLMTFGTPNNTKHYEYELIRFCNLINMTVVGGASKLLKHFEKINKPVSLVTYANRRWSNGNLYNKIGFVLSHTSKPNYFYFHIDKPYKLYSRNTFQKHKLKDMLNIYNDELNETDNMYNNNYRKIYDAGNIIYYKRY